MRRAAAAMLAALTLAALSAGRVSGQSACTVSLDAGVLVAPGEQRGCGIWIVGHDATVARGGVVSGGVTVLYGHAAIDGEVTGSVNVLGGDAAVTGRVRGDVYASGRVRLGPSARVHGNVTGGDVTAARSATVFGTTIQLQRGWAGMPRSGRQWAADGARLLLRALVTLLLAGVFGGLASLAFPTFVGRLRDGARRRPGSVAAATGLGLGCLALTLLLGWMLWRQPASLLITVLPAGLALTGALGIGARLGGRLLPRRHAAWQTGAGMALVTLATTFILQLGHWVFFCTGGLLFVLVGAWSIGIALLVLFRRPDGRSAAATSAPAAPRAAASPGAGAPNARSAGVGSPSTGAVNDAPNARTPAGEAQIGPSDAETVPAGTESPPDAVQPRPVDLRPQPDEGRPLPLQPTPLETQPLQTQPHAALDVRRIPGISPIYAHLLAAAGIRSLVDLADQDPADIVTRLAVPGVLPIDRETAELWVAMARRRVGR